MKKATTQVAYKTSHINTLNKATHPAKRVPVVTLKLIKEASLLYPTRRIKSPLDAFELIKDFLLDADREKFYAAYFNTKHEPVAIHPVSVGSLNCSTVHPREVYKAALLVNAAAVILSHNHPSGDPTPSTEDISVTKRLREAGEIIGIEILDHIIVGSDTKFYSFKEHGHL